MKSMCRNWFDREGHLTRNAVIKTTAAMGKPIAYKQHYFDVSSEHTRQQNSYL